MMTIPIYYGIIIAVLLSLAFANNICNNTYTNGIEIQCFSCEPGYIAIEDCPGNFTSTKCEECLNGTYQPECVTFNETVSCRNCTVCDAYKENCTIYKDAVCDLKNVSQDSSDDSGDPFETWIVAIVTACGYIVIVVTLVFCVLFKKNRNSKCKVDYEKSSNYCQENQDNGNGYDTEMVISDYRQKSYKETTNRCKEDVVPKTSIHKNKDKSSLHNVDGNELPPKSNKNERHIAVVRPHIKPKSNDCKEVENSDDILQHRTRESFQVTGVSENTQVVLHGAEGSESKRPKNQLCHGTEDQSSLRDRDIFKGTPPEFQIDWTKVFLQLSRSFSATRWKFFALELLSNCQEMARSVDDTVNEIELEAKNQHTEGWVFYAYFKVFNKWLNNLGCTSATFEHIEDAATHAFNSEEDKKRIDFIKRNPPMKSTTPMPLVPPYLDLTFRNNSALSQQYMALHDDEIPGNSTNYARDIYVRSRQTHRLHVGHCSYCSRYTTNEVSNLQETSVQLNKTSVDTKDNVKRKRIKKRKKSQSKIQQYKRCTNEEYIIENARLNLLTDSISIRQNDYDMFMNIVLDLISDECHVGKEIVLSITLEEFHEAQEINTKENDTFFLVKSGKTNLFIGKKVYEALADYGNIVRPKLLTYLKTNHIDYDSTASERFLFIKFNGEPHTEDEGDKNVSFNDAKEKGAKQSFRVNGKNDPLIRVSPDIKENEEHVNMKNTLEQNPSDHSLDSEQSKNGIGENNTCIQDELYPEAASNITEHDKKVLDNTAGSGQDTMKNEEKENKKKEADYFDCDIQRELEIIKESFFPTGAESYVLPDAENVAELLNKFVD